ncbi:uncharacterized protein LY89DRAFT_635400 [Mollisia scopiformis]|uniref:tRNA-splicing endonuclease subunit Sen54 N-terminal domain-containing protein n=1 Tax=Mollisia scopiformis TaxID=149040 RepID=A0A194XSR7_MOLSC|nr:uncharacterized protein LY89DRAFT_635400 [Mollisia scopiformis]KUJ23186.1 hypothetical protein LY89DRAFT_635400 [Mollisia scopiformis]
MADVDEDAALRSSQPTANDETELGDEFQDFRFLAALTAKSGGQLPKRGEKDFEPHGTKHQDGILSASRQAMHDALSYTRVHTSKQYNRAFYYGEEGLPRDEVIREDWRQGLDDDHVILVESDKGPHFKTMGKTNTGKRDPGIWLLPEEALYLVERGNLDLWWPSRSSYTSVVPDEDNTDMKEKVDTQDEVDEGFPMSLQAAFSMLIGQDGERGKVSLERYTVYAHLKRMGYAILRASDWDVTQPGKPQSHQVELISEPTSAFSWLFGKFFAEKEIQHSQYGPLVKPGMYRSYNSIYRQIAVIPRHKPNPNPSAPAPIPNDPYRVVFLLWKPSRLPTFAKSNPGLPDFRVAITDARSTCVPSLGQISSLLESTPWAPPKGSEFEGQGKVYQRLKNGWRNVVLAVIDQGVISYLRLGEVAFGDERMYERFDAGGNSGSKRGGGAGRGGRGRGKGRR